MRRHALALAGLLLGGCVVEEPAPEPPTPPLLDDDDAIGDDDDSAGLLPCEPALALTPAEASVLPSSGLVALGRSGGTGSWSLALTLDASGAQINDEYGTYLPGPTPGVTDEVMLTDSGCTGSASATIHVVTPLDVAPRDVEMPPGLGFDVSVAGGSGASSCALLVDGSGGSA